VEPVNRGATGSFQKRGATVTISMAARVHAFLLIIFIVTACLSAARSFFLEVVIILVVDVGVGVYMDQCILLKGGKKQTCRWTRCQIQSRDPGRAHAESHAECRARVAHVPR
jgi:hypothetical protein